MSTQPTTHKRAGGAPRGNENAAKHRWHPLKVRVKVRGLDALDKRTAGARDLLTWKAHLVEDLGGESELTAAQRKLIDIAARTALFVDHIDCYLLEQTTLVNRRKKAVHPVLLQRQSLVDSLTRTLTTLGLERRVRPVESYEDIRREHEVS